MIAQMGSATARAPLEKPAALKAPLFQLMLNELDTGRRCIILDLGAASTGMLNLLSRYRSHVQIADLTGCGGVDMLNSQAEQTNLAELAEYVLPARNDAPIDVVFCWDLLNYLRPNAITALMSAIGARARPGTLAHGLIVYADRTMPDRPGRIIPDDEARLVDKRAAGKEIAAPRYSPEDLGRIMGGFAIERAMLLANGMQEFMFRFQ